MKRLLIIPLLLVAVVALDNIRLQGCGPDAQPSSIAWDDQAYTVVWAAPSSLNVTVWAAQMHDEDFARDSRNLFLEVGIPSDSRGNEDFDRQGGIASVSASGLPEKVLRLSSVLGPPEITRGDGGFLVLVHGGDRLLHAVPLDAVGVPTRDGQVIAKDVDLLCVRPVWSNGSYFAAYSAGEELHIVGLDTDGAVIIRDAISTGPLGRCAMAAGDGRVAVVASGPSTRARIHHSDRALVIETPSATGPLRLARHDNGWEMLYPVDDALEIVHLADDGSRTKNRRVSSAVDPGSVDLARGDNGLFVSWLSGRTVRWGFVDGDDQPGFKTDRSPLGTRTLGHGDTCAMTWTTNGGSRVWVLRVPQCR